MQATKSDRQAIASHPHAMKPQMAQLRAKATSTKAQPSKLASPSKLPGPSRLAAQPSKLANATRSPLAQ